MSKLLYLNGKTQWMNFSQKQKSSADLFTHLLEISLGVFYSVGCGELPSILVSHFLALTSQEQSCSVFYTAHGNLSIAFNPSGDETYFQILQSCSWFASIDKR